MSCKMYGVFFLETLVKTYIMGLLPERFVAGDGFKLRRIQELFVAARLGMNAFWPSGTNHYVTIYGPANS